MKRSLYVHRKVVNASQILEWAKEQGFTSALAPEDLHVTIAFSRRPVDWDQIPRTEDANEQVSVDDGEVYAAGGHRGRTVKSLGDKGAVVLTLGRPWRLASRWEQFCSAGCSWDFPEYQPHVTITYSGAPADLSKVLPYPGPIVLGPEYWDTVDEDWSEKIVEAATMEFAKINEEKRTVYGWASIITKGGVPVVDSQDDIIEADDLVKAAHEFMLGEQEAGLMHAIKSGIGKVVESVVLTKDLQSALGIDLGVEGWFIGVKIEDDTTWNAVKKGTLRAFSIGGTGEREEVGG